MNTNMRKKKIKVYKYNKRNKLDPQTEGIKPSDILHSEASKRIIEGICRVIDNSMSKGMSFDEVAGRLLDPKMKRSDFLYTYIQAYKRNCSYKEHSRVQSTYNNGFRKRDYGENPCQYLDNQLGDMEAFERIYEDYLEAKKAKEKSEEDRDER